MFDSAPNHLFRYAEEATAINTTKTMLKNVLANSGDFCINPDGSVPKWAINWELGRNQYNSINCRGVSTFSVDHLPFEVQHNIIKLHGKDERQLPCLRLPKDTHVPKFKALQDPMISQKSYHFLLTPECPVSVAELQAVATCKESNAWILHAPPSADLPSGSHGAAADGGGVSDDSVRSSTGLPVGWDTVPASPDCSGGGAYETPDAPDWEIEIVIEGLELFALNADHSPNERLRARLGQHAIKDGDLDDFYEALDFLYLAPLAIAGLEEGVAAYPDTTKWPRDVLWRLKEAYALAQKAHDL